MIVIGIDQGLDGAVAAYGTIVGDLMIRTTPIIGSGKRAYDIAACVEIIRGMVPGPASAFLEQAQTIPGRGSASTMQKIGFGDGMWQTALTLLKIPYDIVAPRTWQREMFRGVPGMDSKTASAVIAARMFPHHTFKRTPSCKKMHDGMTDSACIAVYGARKLGVIR